MPERTYEADVIVVGAGLAGIVATLELLDRGRSVVLLDRGPESDLGGLARWSFGGLFLIGTPHQRASGFRDDPARALRDWEASAGFEANDVWPRQWAAQFTELNHEHIYRWLLRHGIHFLPIVHWLERGLEGDGNSVPRFHIVWGTGEELVRRLVRRLRSRLAEGRLQMPFLHRVDDVIRESGAVTGVRGEVEPGGEPFSARAGAVIVASGGVCGSVERVRRYWDPELGTAPKIILNGSHPAADGAMHDACAAVGATATHLERVWFYASGVHHPSPHHDGHGLQVIPSKTALWVNARGTRIGPRPLVSGFDNRYIVERTCAQEEHWTWQVLNKRIAAREFAVSGSEFNHAVREKRAVRFLRSILLGSDALISYFIEHCEDIFSAPTIEDLVDTMNELTGSDHMNATTLRNELEAYDNALAKRGPPFADEQVERIAALRGYRGDRMRTCNFQPILDPDAGPLIAIRGHLLTRKSLGGLLTDLASRVLEHTPDGSGAPIPGLYAVGEAAGFGGGGIHGRRALEGTFLASCVLTARIAAADIAGGSL